MDQWKNVGNYKRVYFIDSQNGLLVRKATEEKKETVDLEHIISIHQQTTIEVLHNKKCQKFPSLQVGRQNGYEKAKKASSLHNSLVSWV